MNRTDATDPRLLGIEIGGTKLQMALGDAKGQIARRWRGEVDRGKGGAEIRRRLEEWIGDLRGGMAPAGVGIGFGGPINRHTGRISCSHHVEGWEDFDLAGWMRRLAGAPVAVDNDANVAAFGEALSGAGAGFDPAFYVTLGTGVGGGLVTGGRIYHGDIPGEAEFGHVRLDRSGTIVEDRCSGRAVDARIRQLQLTRPDSLLARLSVRPDGKAGGEARFLAAAVEQRDEAALTLLAELADDLAFALSHAIHLFHPQVIVLGGGLAKVGEILRRGVADRLDPYVMKIMRPLPEIRLSTLGDDVVPVGALRLCAVEA